VPPIRKCLAPFRQSLRAIDVPSVHDSDDKNDESFVDHLIDDSVVSNPQSSEAGELSLQDAIGVGLFPETIDVFDESDLVVFSFFWRAFAALFLICSE